MRDAVIAEAQDAARSARAQLRAAAAALCHLEARRAIELTMDEPLSMRGDPPDWLILAPADDEDDAVAFAYWDTLESLDGGSREYLYCIATEGDDDGRFPVVLLGAEVTEALQVAWCYQPKLDAVTLPLAPVPGSGGLRALDACRDPLLGLVIGEGLGSLLPAVSSRIDGLIEGWE